MCNSSKDDGGGGDEEWDPSAKRPKHQHYKPRQRGLGVAKLEKILREQKEKEENNAAVAEFSSRLLSALPRQYQPPSSSFLCPALPPVTPQPPMDMVTHPLNLTPAPFSPSPFTVPVIYGDSTMKLPSGVGGGGAGGGPVSVYLHGEGSKLGSGFESNRTNFAPLVLQRELYPYISPMMNHPSMSAAWSNSPSEGVNHYIEHPSNQRPYANCTLMMPEEQKVVSKKRPWPFSNDQPLGPYHPPPFPGEKLHQSPSHGNGAIMLEPGQTISREVSRSSNSELNPKKHYADCESRDGNFLTLAPPRSPSPPRQTSILDFSEVSLFPFQGSIEGQCQSSTPGGSVHQKQLCSFSTEQHMSRGGTALSLSNKRDEAKEDSIDLDLKL